jgi:hypothetical protein
MQYLFYLRLLLNLVPKTVTMYFSLVLVKNVTGQLNKNPARTESGTGTLLSPDA